MRYAVAIRVLRTTRLGAHQADGISQLDCERKLEIPFCFFSFFKIQSQNSGSTAGIEQ